MDNLQKYFIVFMLATLILIISCEPVKPNTSLEKLSDEEFVSLMEEQESNIVGEAGKPPLRCEDDGENLIFTSNGFRRSLPKFFCTGEGGSSQRERICRTSGFISIRTPCEQECNAETGRCRRTIDLYIEQLSFEELLRLTDLEINDLFYSNYASVWGSLDWSRLYGAINVTIINTGTETVYTPIYYFRDGGQIGPLSLLGWPIVPGENRFHHPLFSSVLPYSIHNISVFVDPANIIEEINESNNHASQNVN